MDRKKHQRFWKPMGWFVLGVLVIILLPGYAWLMPVVAFSFLCSLFVAYLVHVFSAYPEETVWKTWEDDELVGVISLFVTMLSLLFFSFIMIEKDPLNYTTYTLGLYPKIWEIAFGC